MKGVVGRKLAQAYGFGLSFVMQFVILLKICIKDEAKTFIYLTLNCVISSRTKACDEPLPGLCMSLLTFEVLWHLASVNRAGPPELRVPGVRVKGQLSDFFNVRPLGVHRSRDLGCFCDCREHKRMKLILNGEKQADKSAREISPCSSTSSSSYTSTSKSLMSIRDRMRRNCR